MQEYPKMLYRGADPVACLADNVIVHCADSEDAARADGYAMYAEIAAEIASESDKDDAADDKGGVKKLKDAIAAAKAD